MFWWIIFSLVSIFVFGKTEKSYTQTVCNWLPKIVYDRCILWIEQWQNLILKNIKWK